jgi:hypothetical protein
LTAPIFAQHLEHVQKPCIVIPGSIGDPENLKENMDSRLPLGHELEAEWRGNDGNVGCMGFSDKL